MLGKSLLFWANEVKPAVAHWFSWVWPSSKCWSHIFGISNLVILKFISKTDRIEHQHIVSLPIWLWHRGNTQCSNPPPLTDTWAHQAQQQTIVTLVETQWRRKAKWGYPSLCTPPLPHHIWPTTSPHHTTTTNTPAAPDPREGVNLFRRVSVPRDGRIDDKQCMENCNRGAVFPRLEGNGICAMLSVAIIWSRQLVLLVAHPPTGSNGVGHEALQKDKMSAFW